MRSFVPEPQEPMQVFNTRRVSLWRISKDPEIRSIQIGIGATVVVHLLLIWLLPDHFENDLNGTLNPQNMAVENKTFNIEMDPDEFVLRPPPQKQQPLKYVEANPDAPDNEPDDTANFSSQNQQAAQEKPPKKDGGDHPEMEGRKDLESNQIVSGNMSEPTPTTPPPPPPSVEAPQAEQQAQLQKERNPLAGFEKDLGDNKEAYGSNIAKIAPHPEDIPNKVEGSPDSQLIEGIAGKQATIQQQPQVPRERPKLDRRARPAIFSENNIGTSNIGIAAWDARWSNYGAYLKRLIDTVQLQWQALIDASHSYPTHGSVVRVKFQINKEGEITKVLDVEGGIANQLAESWCVSAITKPAPYGKWSEDMVKVLGEQQEMTFAFFYQ